MCLHRNSRHSNQASSGQQHALITTFFCYNHVKESFLFFFFMNFLSKFCDTIFFYHANPLTVILSSKCCMMFLVMVFSDIITLFSMFTNPQRKSFLATTEPSGEHLKSSAAQLLLLFCWCRWHQRISSADIWSFRRMFSALSLTFPLTDVWHLLP